MSFEQFLTNPKAHVVKKYMAELLKEEYAPNAEIIERISNTLLTKQDMEGFSRLIGTIYSAAYKKCVEDHKEQLRQIGIETTIKEDRPQGPVKNIF